MPRIPSNPHVLRTARSRLGLSQIQLAELVGVAPITIRRIEAGQLNLGRSLAVRISIATSLDTEQLLDNADPETPRFYQRSKNADQPPSPQRIATDLSLFGEILKDLLGRPKTLTRYEILYHCLSTKIAELRHELSYPLLTHSPRAFDRKATAARKRQLQPVSPGYDNDERKSVSPRRAPSLRQSRARA
jgi:transcriptional regulator with XRE-family HTH domain